MKSQELASESIKKKYMENQKIQVEDNSAFDGGTHQHIKGYHDVLVSCDSEARKMGGRKVLYPQFTHLLYTQSANPSLNYNTDSSKMFWIIFRRKIRTRLGMSTQSV